MAEFKREGALVVLQDGTVLDNWDVRKISVHAHTICKGWVYVNRKKYRVISLCTRRNIWHEWGLEWNKRTVFNHLFKEANNYVVKFKTTA